MKLKDIPDDRALIIFDGYCILCNGLISLLLKLDTKKKFVFANFDSSIWKAISQNFMYQSDSIILYKNGKFSIQSEAVLRIIETLDYPWKALRIVRLIPFILREKLYRIIARNRYTIFGRRTSCKIPSRELQERFIL